jgi:transcriptional regulator with XRE-family HTH domain
MLSRNDSDFIVGSNGHARLSQAKVGELLKVSQQAISKLIRANNLGFSESPETLAQYGFDGNNLAVLVEYYAFDSRQASKETVNQCRSIYRQAASKSFQDFIDALAGLEIQDSQQPPQFYKRLQLFHERTGRIPAGWFCIFEEIVPLVAQLERYGYCLPEDAVIDGSIGKRFCSYLRDEYEIEPDNVCMKYPHWYPGRRNAVPANLYPLNLIQVFREWLEYRYYNQYLIPYFKGKKDPEALQAVSKFLGLLPST